MITIIAAVGRDGAIGRKGDLIRHLSEDLRHFKKLTTGHPVIMGRKTWDSLPKKPLPGRRNIVVTRRPELIPAEAEPFTSLAQAVEACAGEDPFIIGGGQIYAEALPLADSLQLTLIDEDTPDADTYFPDYSSDWEEVKSEAGNPPEGCPAYRFAEFRRKWAHH